MTADGPAILRGFAGALKLGVAWALLGPLLAVATATALGALIGGWWPLLAQWLLHIVFFALLLGSWLVIFGDRPSSKYWIQVIEGLKSGVLMGALAGLAIAGATVFFGVVEVEDNSLSQTLYGMAGVLAGRLPVAERPEDGRALDVWFYIKMLGVIGLVAGAAREPSGKLWQRLKSRRTPPS